MSRDFLCGMVWLGCAFTALLATWVGFYPAVIAAGWLSADGILSPTFARLIERSQHVLVTALFLTAPLAFAADRLAERLSRLAEGPLHARAIAALAILSLLLTYTIQCSWFGNMPHMTDAISHVFQARIFALGRTWVPLPPCYEHFFQHKMHMTESGRWFTLYPPGHALVLLVAMKVQALHFYGPLAMAASTALSARIVERFHGPRIAVAYAAFFAISPILLLIGGSYMSHITSMLFTCAGLVTGLSGLDHGLAAPRRFGRLTLAGFLLGMVGLTRPQDALVLAPAILLGMALARRHIAPVAWHGIAAFLAGAALPAGLQLLWNRSVYGIVLAVGYGETPIGDLMPLSLPRFGLGGSFTLPVAIEQTAWCWTRFDQALLGWPAGIVSLLAAVALLRRPDRRDLVALVAVITTISFYFFYEYYGFEYEARYYTVAAPFVLLLVLRGLQSLSRLRFGALVVPAVAACTLHAVLHYGPARLRPVYAADYEQATPDVRHRVESVRLENAVVLIDDSPPNLFRYSGGFVWNDPLLRDSVIYARDLGKKNACLVEMFPGRTFYRYVPDAPPDERLAPAPLQAREGQALKKD